MKNYHISNSQKNLRHRAKIFLNKNPTLLLQYPANDVSKLVQELHIQQIELEMQNEELRKTQLALEESRNRYQHLYDYSPISYFILNRNGIIDDANITATHLLDVKKSDLIKNRFINYISSDCQEKFHHYRRDLFLNNERRTIILPLLNKNKKVFHAQITGIVVPDAGKKSSQLRLAIVDITEQYEAEKKIQQQEFILAHIGRIKSIGEIAAGITHEFKQPLAAITNYINGCIARMQQENISSELTTMMKRALTQAQRATDIIDRLKAFINKQQTETVFLDVNKLITEVLEWLNYDLQNTHIKVQLHFSDTLPKIKANKTHLQQAFFNIIQNAVEALQKTDSSPYIHIQTRQITNDEIVIDIEDNGKGIPSDQTTEIFNAFFTTKSTGMGLGLSIANSIIKMHHGSISVTSEILKGTRFQILLPHNCDIQHEIIKETYV